MGRLLKSFFYKLFRDNTFRIVAIIGVCLAVVLTIINCNGVESFMGSGAYCFISSISPSQNFGIAIPINLSIFLTLLFGQGIIRNQVIVGNSKTKIFFSLLIGGSIFNLILIALYVGICTGLGSAIKGFYNGIFKETLLPAESIIKIVVVTIVNYILLAVYTVFITSIFKTPGASISLVLIPIILFSILSMVLTIIGKDPSSPIPTWLIEANKYINPQYLIGRLTGLLNVLMNDSKQIAVTTQEFIIGIVNNVVYIILFSGFGCLIFNKRELK